jgi:hypothetical protein
MFKIETVKVDPTLYSTHAKYEKLYPTEAAAIHLVDSQGKYTNIGSGAFGTVYGCRDTNIVYKVGEVKYNTAYLSYVRELLRLKTPNKFLPAIYGCRIFKHRGDSHFVVAMERLKEGKGNAYYDAVDCMQCVIQDDDWDAYKDIPAKFIINIGDLKKATKVIDKAYNTAIKSDDCVELDLHSGNFMLRGKNEIVITDPIA